MSNKKKTLRKSIKKTHLRKKKLSKKNKSKKIGLKRNTLKMTGGEVNEKEVIDTLILYILAYYILEQTLPAYWIDSEQVIQSEGSSEDLGWVNENTPLHIKIIPGKKEITFDDMHNYVTQIFNSIERFKTILGASGFTIRQIIDDEIKYNVEDNISNFSGIENSIIDKLYPKKLDDDDNENFLIGIKLEQIIKNKELLRLLFSHFLELKKELWNPSPPTA